MASPPPAQSSTSPVSPGHVAEGSPGNPQLFIPDLAVEAETDQVSFRAYGFWGFVVLMFSNRVARVR